MKKKNGRTVKERTFVNRENPTNAFVKTNGSVNVHKITKPKKINRSRFFLNQWFFLNKTGNDGEVYLVGAGLRRGSGWLRRGRRGAAGLRGLGGGEGRLRRRDSASGGFVRPGRTMSGAARRISRVSDEGDPDFGGILFIEVEEARRVQMRCGFHPHDCDRTTESIEGV